jgi:hypothetical protein
MSEGLARYFGGKVLSAVLAVAVVLVVIWYWRLTPEARDAMWGTARGALIWLGFVVALPWATFFVPIRVVRMDSNRASGLMIAGYLVVCIALSIYQMGGLPEAAWELVLVVVGWLVALTYTYAACEFIARKVDEAAPS